MKPNKAPVFILSIVTLLNISFVFSQEKFIKMELDSVMSANYLIKKAAISSENDEFGVFTYNDTLYFSSNKKRRSPIQYLSKERNYPFNIYYVSNNKKNSTLLKGEINKKLNESLPVITKDGTTMYYTANWTRNKKNKNNLHVLKATKKNGIWGAITDLSINSDSYSTGQAVLNADETKMYFVSDRDTVSGSDIYVVDLHKDGSLGLPRKLNRNINSTKNETSPFITSKNELYFSSNREGGYGGLDIYYINLNDKDAVPINLGNTINTASDEFSFSINKATSKGYVSSNKEGNLNIYELEELDAIVNILQKKKEIEKKNEIYFKNLRIRNYEVVVVNKKIDAKAKITFEKGTSTVLTKEGKEFLEYLIVFAAKNTNGVIDINDLIEDDGKDDKLLNRKISYIINQVKDKIQYSYRYKIIPVDPKSATAKKEQIKEGTLLYYGRNLAELDDFSKEKLDLFTKDLKTDRSFKIHIKTYADSRGTDAYNMTLTQRRYQRVKRYLIAKGIKSSQISGEAFGETKILNKCINGVVCDEESHKVNRRVEYTIIKRNNLNKKGKIIQKMK